MIDDSHEEELTGRREAPVAARPWAPAVVAPPPPPVNSAGIAAADPAEAAGVAEPPRGLTELSPDRILRRRPGGSSRGWRRAVRTLSFGLVRPGPSPAELREAALLDAVRTPVRGCRRIAVLSRKGGVGKTTTTLMLGHTFASLRGDRVVALDANPDAGSLGYRVARETDATVTQLLAARADLHRYSDLRRYTSQAPSRLEVVASDDDPGISERLGEREYRDVVHTLEDHFNILLIDTGTGVLDSAAQGVLRMCDQIVVCAGPGIDASRASSFTLDWLERHGYADLVHDAVVIVNQVRAHSEVDVDAVVSHFFHRCRAVVRVPWDPRLAAGGETTLEELQPATHEAYLVAAAAVARSFAHPGKRR
jgi:putative peptide zinc metalloprotease protein